MKTILLIALSLVGLIVSVAFALWIWVSVGDVEIGGHGWAALLLGVVISLVVGGGLMVLVFFSSRRGYDEAAYYTDDDQG